MEVVLHERQGPSRKHQKRTLARLLNARSDLSAAHHALETLLREAGALAHPLHFPLQAAAIICYARPFTDNDEIGALPEKYSRFVTNAATQAHETAMDVRNHFIAHSDFAARQPTILPTGWVIGAKDGRELKSSGVGVQTTSSLLARNVVLQLHNNCVDLMKRLHGDIDDLTEALYGGMELPARPFPLRLDDGL